MVLSTGFRVLEYEIKKKNISMSDICYRTVGEDFSYSKDFTLKKTKF